MKEIIQEDVYLGHAGRGQKRLLICSAPYRAAGYWAVKRRVYWRKTHIEVTVCKTNLSLSLFLQTNRLIKHELRECCLTVSVCLRIPTYVCVCVSTVHSSSRHTSTRGPFASQILHLMTREIIWIYWKPAQRVVGACSSFRSEMHKIATSLHRQMELWVRLISNDGMCQGECAADW